MPVTPPRGNLLHVQLHLPSTVPSPGRSRVPADLLNDKRCGHPAAGGPTARCWIVQGVHGLAALAGVATGRGWRVRRDGGPREQLAGAVPLAGAGPAAAASGVHGWAAVLCCAGWCAVLCWLAVLDGELRIRPSGSAHRLLSMGFSQQDHQQEQDHQ
jgi:hypothetical protein